MNNNGFWYDIFHIKTNINWFLVLYCISCFTTIALLILSIVAFTYSGYWYYGFIGLILAFINLRIVIVALEKAV